MESEKFGNRNLCDILKKQISKKKKLPRNFNDSEYKGEIKSFRVQSMSNFEHLYVLGIVEEFLGRKLSDKMHEKKL